MGDCCLATLAGLCEFCFQGGTLPQKLEERDRGRHLTSASGIHTSTQTYTENGSGIVMVREIPIIKT